MLLEEGGPDFGSRRASFRADTVRSEGTAWRMGGLVLKMDQIHRWVFIRHSLVWHTGW